MGSHRGGFGPFGTQTWSFTACSSSGDPHIWRRNHSTNESLSIFNRIRRCALGCDVTCTNVESIPSLDPSAMLGEQKPVYSSLLDACSTRSDTICSFAVTRKLISNVIKNNLQSASCPAWCPAAAFCPMQHLDEGRRGHRCNKAALRSDQHPRHPPSQFRRLALFSRRRALQALPRQYRLQSQL